MALVERRLGLIAQMLPEVDVVALVSKQPAILRRDVEKSLKPRLAFMTVELGPDAAISTISANPRLLLSSWGALGRLTFVRETTGGEGDNAVSASLALMAPKAQFQARFPAYRGWLMKQLEIQINVSSETTSRGQDEPSMQRAPSADSSPLPEVEALEKAFGDRLEDVWQTAAGAQAAAAEEK